MILVYAILGQIRRVTENQFLAQQFSLATLCYSIVWNFCYFIIHFDIALNKEVIILTDHNNAVFSLSVAAFLLVLHDMLCVRVKISVNLLESTKHRDFETKSSEH